MTPDRTGGLLAPPTFDRVDEAPFPGIGHTLIPGIHSDRNDEPLPAPESKPGPPHDRKLIDPANPIATSPSPETNVAIGRSNFANVGSIAGFFGFVGSLAVLFSMMWPMLSIPFGVIDDHEIPDIIGTRSRLPLSQVGSAIADRWNEPIGRFRPGYWVLRVLESALAGRNSEFWFINRFVLAAITLGAIYTVARHHMGVLASATVALIPFLGPQFETWRRLGTNETYAVPMMCVGLALIHRAVLRSRPPSAMWPGFVLLTLAGATKENFLLVTVVVVGAVVLLHGFRRLGRRDWIVIGCTLAVWSANGAAMALKLKGHGSVYSQPHTLESAITFARYALDAQRQWQSFSLGSLLLLGLAVAGILGGFSGRQLPSSSASTTNPIAPVIGFIGAVAVTAALQIGFYSGAPSTGRYLYPLAFTPALLWGSVGHRLQRQSLRSSRVIRKRVLPLTLPVLLIIPITQAFSNARHQIAVSKTENVAFQAGLRRIVAAAANTHATSIVIQPEDPWLDMERTMAMARFLNTETGLPVMTLPVTKSGVGLKAQLAREMQSWSTRGASRIAPYVASTTCLSVIFGTNTPVCPASVPTADSGY